MNIPRQHQSGQIGRFQGADQGHAEAEAVFDDLVDILGAGDFVVQERYGFAPQGMLETVAEKSGNILEHPDGHFPHFFHQPIDRVEGFLRRCGPLDHLDAGDDMGRVPEVGSQETCFVPKGGADLGDAQGGCVAGQDGVRRRQFFDRGVGVSAWRSSLPKWPR